jgi:Phage tail tube protein
MAETYADIGYVGFGVEVTEGTMVAPTVFLPANSFSFDSTNEFMTPSQLRGSRDKTVKMASPYSVSGTMGMELVPIGIASLLTSAFSSKGGTGVVTTSLGAGAYQHVFTPGNSSPTFTAESSAADILVMRYGGLRVNTLEISSAFGEIVTSTWGFEGTTRGKQGSASTESVSTVNPFHFSGSYVQLNTVQLGNVQNFTFNVGNNVERRGTLTKTRSYRRTLLGTRDVGLSMTMDFEDTADYDLFLAETEFAVRLNLEGDYIVGSSGQRYGLFINIPRVSYNTINAPLTAGDFITQDVQCTIVKPLNGDPIFTATLINNETSVPGAA